MASWSYQDGITPSGDDDGFLARYTPPPSPFDRDVWAIRRGNLPRVITALGPMSHRIQDTWETGRLRQDVLEIFDTRRVRFNLIGIFGVAPATAPLVPAARGTVVTIVALIEPDSITRPGAVVIVRALYGLLQSYGFLNSVAIELLEGCLQPHCGCEERTRVPDVPYRFENIYTSPSPGCSISPSSSLQTGTLGYFLKLRVATGQESILALTSSHALAPGIRTPISLLESSRNEMTVESPSTADHDSWTDFLTTQALAGMSLNGHGLGVSHPLVSGAWLAASSFFPRTIGVVRLTSGSESTVRLDDSPETCRLDFGIIDLGDGGGRYLSNEYSQESLQRLGDICLRSRRFPIIFKAGRSTGMTIGQRHVGTVVCRFYGNPDGTEKETLESVLVGFPRGSSPNFTEAGDEGAVIWELANPRAPITAIGVVSGGARSRPGSELDLSGICFYSPMQAVTEHLTHILEEEFGVGNFELSNHNL